MAAAENFTELAPNVEINVSISGTGGGFERFCNGETDHPERLSRRSPRMKPPLCAENGVDYYEFEVAYDGITIVVPESNTFLTCISTDVLARSGTARSRTSTRSTRSSRTLRSQLFGPDSESGTYDYFNEEILGEDEAGEMIEPAADYEPSSDDNVLVEGVSGTEGGLGYFGYAYYETAQDRLNAVAVTADGDLNNCVVADPDTIRSQEYAPLSRPLFVYVKASSLAENPALQEFMRYYIADASAIATAPVRSTPRPRTSPPAREARRRHRRDGAAGQPGAPLVGVEPTLRMPGAGRRGSSRRRSCGRAVGTSADRQSVQRL